MMKPVFADCENKGTDQLHRNYKADQHLCFHYIDSTICKFEISSRWPSSVAVQPGLCQTPNTGFIMTYCDLAEIFIDYNKLTVCPNL